MVKGKEHKMTFTKEDTNIVKGIAILAMVFHHIYPNNTGLPIYTLDNPGFLQLVASCGKICVALLTILSGYGLAESYKKIIKGGIGGNIRFVFSHYFQLLSMYWAVYFIVSAVIYLRGGSLIAIYGIGIRGVCNFIIDLLGLATLFHTSVLIGGWYLTAIIAFYFLFPLFLILTKKMKWGVLIISYIPWLYYMIMKDVNMHTDWFLFYIFSFILGIYLSCFNWLNWMKKNAEKKQMIVISIVLLVIMIALRLYITLPIDPFLSLAVIMVEIVIISKLPHLKRFLCVCGTESANIWLVHPWLLGEMATFTFKGYVAKYIVGFFASFAVAYVISSIKKGTGYNDMVRRIRGKIVGREA